MAAASLPPSVVRIRTTSGAIVGSGVLVGRTEVLTCAHVVNLALDRDPLSAELPDGPIRVEFPATDEFATGVVHRWAAPPAREGLSGDDIASIRLDSPVRAEPARLIATPPAPGHPVDVFGYPADRPDGVWAHAVVRGEVGGRVLQLDAVAGAAVRVQRGFSGGAVWDSTTRRVVGIVVAAGDRDSYAIPAERLRGLRAEHRSDPVGDVTVLHLAGPLVALPDDIGRPDLIVHSGDLTTAGRPSEFEHAFGLLGRIAEEAGLHRDRVVVVPGDQDVNKDLCAAYFTAERAREREPVAPYWPKWEPYAAAFEEFYRGRFTFTPDEPWTVFDIPDLEVVVSGLNSTITDTHHYSIAEVGKHQMKSVLQRLDEYDSAWLRLTVGHDLPGARAGTVQLSSARTVQQWSDRTLRFARPGRGPHGNPTGRRGATSRDVFFDNVLEATRVKHPEAVVTPFPDQRYIRISERRPGGGVALWPVGVGEGEASERMLAVFVADVHRSFAAADPAVPSELVHEGPPATADLVRTAGRDGVWLRSFVEYQGMLDLRPLAERQANRLARDDVYPAALYVAQRYTDEAGGEIREDVLERVVDWLGQETARFVVVLGDFGRGKSFLLRQLTRELPRRRAGLLPVLVELRSLEKAPTLDELLAQHLVHQGVEDLGVKKLRYMISSGRLALLFDGFDELELRVGYDNATDYLTTLLQAVTDRAKVVLTSRTQHFRSTDQVRTALGARVASLNASRVVVLEDFTDDQIRDWLVRHYNGDADRADRRFDLLGAIRDLLGLSRNPRMLSFIADLDEERLRAVQRRHGQISAAELYRELVDYWLLHEADRQQHKMGVSSLDEHERLDACVVLALKLWEGTATTIPATDLTATAATVLTRLAERGYSHDEAAHAVGSGTLLVRNEDGGFAFVHQSVVEWLVAKVASTGLDDPANPVATRRMSRLMVDFFCDMAGHQAALDWAQRVLAEPQSSEQAKQNAADVVRRLGSSTPITLSDVDVRVIDLSALDLRGAVLRGANLTGQRLVDRDLTGADLTGATLRGVRMFGGSLRNAVLADTDWRGAALIGVADVPATGTAEAAVLGRDPLRSHLTPPTTPVQALAYSPSGELLAIARTAHVELVDPDSLTPLSVLWPLGRIADVAFSPDGRTLAVALRDGWVVVYDVELGGVVRTWRAHSAAVNSLAYSPDGTRLATASSDCTARVWETSGWNEVRELTGHARRVRSVAYSPDGNWLATASDDNTAVLWDAVAGRRERVLADHLGAVSGVVFSPDSTTLATSSGDHCTRLWSLTGAVLSLVAGHDERLRGLAYSPDNRLLVTVSTDRVQLWEIGSGTPPTALTLGRDLRAIALSPDGEVITTGRGDGEVTRWSVDGPALRRSQGRSPEAHAVTSGRYAIRAGDVGCDVWDLTTDRVDQRWAPENVTAVAHSDGRVAYGTAGVGVFVVRQDGTVTTFNAETNWTLAVEFAPNRRLLATIGKDGLVRVWPLDHGSAADPWSFGRRVRGMVFSPHGTGLLTRSDSEVAEVWQVSAGEPVISLRGTGNVTAVAWSPDDRLVATGHADGTVRLWPTEWAKPPVVLETDDGSITAVAFDPGANVVATASDRGRVRIWTLDGEPVHELRRHLDRVGSVSFSADGVLLTESDDGRIRRFDTTTGELLSTHAMWADGRITVLPNGSFRVSGVAEDRIWWAIRLCRFGADELDAYLTADQLPDAPDTPVH
ncbi:trypsin-like peptidase domain-containing protein [Actinosynnema sp. NPDC020468]|uniref:WD40 domain-containing protein n=1 Tax=Actinosynnema sp. NPDC020468 TaxID=3154488 RepID=UPI0033C05472